MFLCARLSAGFLSICRVQQSSHAFLCAVSSRVCCFAYIAQFGGNKCCKSVSFKDITERRFHVALATDLWWCVFTFCSHAPCRQQCDFLAKQFLYLWSCRRHASLWLARLFRGDATSKTLQPLCTLLCCTYVNQNSRWASICASKTCCFGHAWLKKSLSVQVQTMFRIFSLLYLNIRKCFPTGSWSWYIAPSKARLYWANL